MMVTFMKKFSTFIAFLVVLLSAGYIFLVHTVMPKYIRQSLPEVERIASSFINGSVTVGDLTWDGGLSAEMGNLVIKDAQVALTDAKTNYLQAMYDYNTCKTNLETAIGVPMQFPTKVVVDPKVAEAEKAVNTKAAK